MRRFVKNFQFVLGNRRLHFSVIMLAALALNAVLTPLSPLFLKYVFDQGVIEKNFKLFMFASLGFMAAATFWRLLNMAVNLSLQRLKYEIIRNTTTRLLEKYYRLPYELISRQGSAYYASRIYDEPLRACVAALDLALDVGKSLVAFVSALFLVAVLSPKATAMLLLTVPLLLYLGKQFGSEIERKSCEEKEHEGCLRDFLVKAAEAHRVVNMFVLRNRVAAGFRVHLLNYVNRSYERFRGVNVHNTFGSILISYGEMLVTVVCGYEILCGRMTFGSFMAFMNAFWIAVVALRTLMEKRAEFSQVSALLQRLMEFESFGESMQPVISADGRIELENASIKFGNNVVFSDLNLSISRGEKVLLVGENGSGKSTVLNVIAGFLQPCKGVARTLGMDQVSACIAPHQFIPGTVRDNLYRDGCDPSASAYMQLIVDELDLSSSMDDDPDKLSAGQKKRLEIAMGLLKEADLYLFDEPLANIDENGKAKIMRLIFRRAASKSLLVVMHGDSEFQQRFDRVINIHCPREAERLFL
jgi:ATP-binding cassette subfamily B protein